MGQLDNWTPYLSMGVSEFDDRLLLKNVFSNIDNKGTLTLQVIIEGEMLIARKEDGIGTTSHSLWFYNINHSSDYVLSTCKEDIMSDPSRLDGVDGKRTQYELVVNVTSYVIRNYSEHKSI